MAASERLLRQLVALLISALTFAACGQQTAEFDNTPPVIGGVEADAGETERAEVETSATTSAEVQPAPTSADTPTTVAEPTAAPEPTELPAPTNTPEPEAEPEADDSTGPSDEFELGGRGSELGCENATSLRLLLLDTQVGDIMEQMQPIVWLCPGTDDVAAELSCYYDEMAQLLVAFEERMGDGGVLLANDFRRGDQVFCRSPASISLRPEDILERQEEERQRQEQGDS